MAHSETRDQKIITLAAAQPNLTKQQIADILQCSRSTVNRALQGKSDLITETAAALETHLAKQLAARQSIADAAANLVDLAVNSDQDSIKLGAQERVLAWQGMRTAQQKANDRFQEVGEHKPMFSLPNLNINVMFGGRPKTTTSSSELLSNGAIDIKPLNPKDE